MLEKNYMRKIIIVITSVCALLGVIIATGFSLRSGGENHSDMKLSIKNDLQEYGIEVVGYEDSNFDAELKQYVGIGNYEGAVQLVNVVEPFAFFIKNDSQKEIVGIALRWQLVDSIGEINDAKQIVSSPGILMGLKPRDPFMVGKTSLVNAKSTRFVSYFRNVETEVLNLFKSNRSKRFEHNLDPSQIQSVLLLVESQKEAKLKDVSRISVVIDAIIFNDGTFVGENQTFFFESMNGTIQARRDFLRELRSARQLHKSDTNALNEFSAKGIRTDAGTVQRHRGPLDARGAFEQAYKVNMAGFIDEIAKKRLKATDTNIVDDFLKVEDSDFIELKMEGYK